MYRTLSSIILLFATWLLWSGHYTALLLGLGAASCALVAYLCRRMGIIDAEGHPVHLLGGLLGYLPWLAWALIQANIDVARQILSPRLCISPRLFRVKASQKTHLGQVIYANSITLTPGTVAVNVEEGAIAVHALTRRAAEELMTGEMDRRVTRLENEG